ncbi:MAG: helix-turn-helix domain-containing protein [Steroidobacteraceae bacterium]
MNPSRHDTPTREIFIRLGDRWSSLLILLLSTGDLRNATLKRLAGAMSHRKQISQRMLILRLRSLERDGLVTCVHLNTRPPGTQYSLTEMGRDFARQIDSMLRWVAEHGNAIESCQRHFDAKRKRR